MTSSPLKTTRSATDERTFFRHVRNYLSATTTVGILEFVGLAVFTRLMSTSEYGVYSVYVGAVGVLAVFFELNLRGAVGRYYLERSDDFASFLRSTLVIVGVSISVFVGVLYLLRTSVAEFFAVTPFVLGLAVVSAVGQVPWNIKWKLLVAQEKSGTYGRLAVAKSAVALIASVAAVSAIAYHFTGRIGDPGEESVGREFGLIGGITGAAFLFAVPLTYSLLRESRGGKPNWAHVRYGLAFGVPLIAHSLSTQILTFFDRIALNQIESASAVGLYTFAYNLGMAMGAVVTAMNQAWLPVFMDLRREERFDEIRQLARKYSFGVAGAALFFVVFARELGTLLGDSRYHEALTLVPVVVFAYVMVFIYTIYANHSFYLRRTWVISTATVAAGALNIGLNYWLIPLFGYVAAAWTTLASYVAMAAMHYGIARFVQRERIVPITTLAGPILVAAALAYGFAQLDTWIGSPWISLLALKLPLIGLVLLVLRARKRQQKEGS